MAQKKKNQDLSELITENSGLEGMLPYKRVYSEGVESEDNDWKVIESGNDPSENCHPEYDAILARFDRTLEEFEQHFKANEELTQRLLQEHLETELFIDEFLSEDD